MGEQGSGGVGRVGRPLTEQCDETPAGPVQPHLERALRAAHRRRGLLVAEPVPCDEREQLAVGVRQSAQGGGDGVVLHRLRPRDIGVVLAVVGDAVGQGGTPAAAAPDVGAHVPGHTQQPGQAVGRHLAEPAPGHHERLGDDVLDLVGKDVSTGIPENRRRVLEPEPVEHLLRAVAHGDTSA